MTSAVAETPQTVSLFDLPECRFTTVSLEITTELSFEHWERLGRQLQLAEIGVQWWIGDWLRYGERRYGEMYAQAVEATGKKEHTLANYVYVAKAIESSRRRENVDFSTHAEVASLPEADQDRLLAKAANENLPRRTVRREAERIKRASNPKPVEDTELVLGKAARAYLDDYINELARWPEKIPLLPASEREAIEKMIYEHGAQALWVKNRTRAVDYNAIAELFSFGEGTSGLERASRSDISAWLDKRGRYMSDADLDERLDAMVENKTLQVNSVEDSRQENRRGSMIEIYGLHPDYEARQDAA